MTEPEVRIVVPASNEEHRISATVREYCEHFGERARIVVVANGCTDATESVVSRLQERYANLALIAINARIGKGGAVRAGFSSGVEPLAGFADADGSTSALEFDRLIARLREFEADGAIGSRWMHGAIMQRRQPLLRRIASRVFNAIVRAFFRLSYHDTQCGAKVFTRAAIDEILPRLELSDFAFDVDLLYKLRKAGRRVLEFPIAWSESSASTVRLAAASWAMFTAVVRLRLRDSLIARVPFFEYVGRRSVIPVADKFRILVLGTLKDQQRSVDVYAEALAQAWQDEGHTVQWLQTSRSWQRVRIALWYALFGRREYDALVEVRSGIPYFLPAFSMKPRYLIEEEHSNRASLGGRWYARWYANVPRIRPTAGAADRAGRILDEIKSKGLYVALFDRRDGNWSITFKDMESQAAKRQQL